MINDIVFIPPDFKPEPSSVGLRLVCGFQHNHEVFEWVKSRYAASKPSAGLMVVELSLPLKDFNDFLIQLQTAQLITSEQANIFKNKASSVYRASTYSGKNAPHSSAQTVVDDSIIKKEERVCALIKEGKLAELTQYLSSHPQLVNNNFGQHSAVNYSVNILELAALYGHTDMVRA